MENQCDGCRRGLPVDAKGIHRGNGGPDMQACTADRYERAIKETNTRIAIQQHDIAIEQLERKIADMQEELAELNRQRTKLSRSL